MAGNAEKCALTDQGAGHLFKMRQLQALRLGTAGKAPEDNKFTGNGFKAAMQALRELSELAVLEMQLP